MKPVNLQKLDDIVRPAVEGHGYELVDVSFRRDHGQWVFQVTIDRRQGQGFISHQDCAQVSREVSVLLDLNEGLLPVNYNLEVSSPGEQRPLKNKADFLRFVGQWAKIRLKDHAAKETSESSSPRKNFTGVIHSVVEDEVLLQLEGGASIVNLLIKDIEKAHLTRSHA